MNGKWFSFIFCVLIFRDHNCTAKDLRSDLERFQAKIDEIQVKEEEIIHHLQKENAELIDRLDHLKKSATSSAILRTCQEYLDLNPSATSGDYTIDPDGNGAGEPPFTVYCDMTSGTTKVSHDSENPTEVTKCADPGCYVRPVNYAANRQQINALKQLSLYCQQRIQYNCFFAPFHFNSMNYAWWDDVNGNRRFYWAGDNNTVHICQCGIANKCLDSMPCNCDALVPENITDDGYVTNKDDLPIMKLNFGRTLATSSKGIHTLGKLECYGKLSFPGEPSSCQDLWTMGHTLNGYYTVKKNNIFQLVFCDMAKLNSPEMETFEGIVSVNYPQGIYFDAYNTKPSTGPVKLTYDQVTALGCQVTDGNFQANKEGFYSLSFLAYSVVADTKVDIVVNGNKPIGSASITANGSNTISINVIAHLNVNDRVAAYLIGSLGLGSNAAYTHFSGALL